MVVICFLIVSLTYWLQQTTASNATPPSCDLLSNCIFDLLITAVFIFIFKFNSCDLLSNCIFDLLITALIHDRFLTSSCDLLSNCIFDLLITAWRNILNDTRCCDLLSNCIFDLLITALTVNCPVPVLLWFAF